VIRRPRRFGFVGPIPGGRHMHMAQPARRIIIPIPRHGGRDVSVGVLRSILRDAGISVEEWLAT
jgi:predicted RNA binding protein YcfA (HicA-like mRNA interferase family)